MLQARLFPGGIPVEACDACRGIFLRAGDTPLVAEQVLGLPRRVQSQRRRRNVLAWVQAVVEIAGSVLGLHR
jgi:hypothetical protein